MRRARMLGAGNGLGRTTANSAGARFCYPLRVQQKGAFKQPLSSGYFGGQESCAISYTANLLKKALEFWFSPWHQISLTFQFTEAL